MGRNDGGMSLALSLMQSKKAIREFSRNTHALRLGFACASSGGAVPMRQIQATLPLGEQESTT